MLNLLVPCRLGDCLYGGLSVILEGLTSIAAAEKTSPLFQCFKPLDGDATLTPTKIKKPRQAAGKNSTTSKASQKPSIPPAPLASSLPFAEDDGFASGSTLVSPTSTLDTNLSELHSSLTTQSNDSDSSSSVGGEAQDGHGLQLLLQTSNGAGECPTPTLRPVQSAASAANPTWDAVRTVSTSAATCEMARGCSTQATTWRASQGGDAKDAPPVVVTVSLGGSAPGATADGSKQMSCHTPAVSHFSITPAVSHFSITPATGAATCKANDTMDSFKRSAPMAACTTPKFWQGTASSIKPSPASVLPVEEEQTKTAAVKEQLLDIMTRAKQLDGALRTLGESFYAVSRKHPDVALFHATSPSDARSALSSRWMQLNPPTVDADASVLLALAGWTGTGAYSATPQPLADMLRAYLPDVWAKVEHLTKSADADAFHLRSRRSATSSAAQRRSMDIDAKLALPDLAQLLLGNALLAAQQRLTDLQNQLSDVVSWWNQQFSVLSKQCLLQLSFIIDRATFQLETTHTNLCACKLDMDRVEQALARRLLHQPARLRMATSGRTSLQLPHTSRFDALPATSSARFGVVPATPSTRFGAITARSSARFDAAMATPVMRYNVLAE